MIGSMSRTTVINLVLAVALLGLCGWLLFFVAGGSAAAPGKTPAEERVQVFSDVNRAARAETLAFLKVDHTRMDELTEQVLNGATGTFKKQYQTSVEALKKSATSQESFATGSIDEIGLGEVDADSATAFVAASSEVRNKATKGEVENRAWRMKLSMVKEDGRWLVSNLEFVG